MKTLAERIRWARIKRGLKSSEVDVLAGLSLGHCAKVERSGVGGRRSPSVVTASKIAHALGVDVGWLINGGKVPVFASTT
jgi:transcriptional regulator with XRE-family HTH domain